MNRLRLTVALMALVAGAAFAEAPIRFATGMPLRFDGASRIALPGLAKAVPARADFHLSFRMRTDGPSAGHAQLLSANAGQPGRAEIGLSPDGPDAGKPYFWMDGGPRLVALSRMDDGKWHEIALLRRNGRFSLMIDEFVDAEGDSDAPICVTDRGWTLGGYVLDRTKSLFKGEISDLRIETGVCENPAVIPVAELEKNCYDWTNRHERILREGPGLKPQVVLIGDSITHAWADMPSIGGADARDVWKRDFAGIRALDLGFGFDRTQNLLWRIDHGELDGLDPKVVVLLAGINNFGSRGRKLHARGNTSWETAEGVIAVRERIAAKLPTAHVLLMGIFPRGREKDSFYRNLPLAANALLRRKYANDPNTTYVDAWGALLDESGYLSKEVSHDSVHLTAEGFRRWRAVLAPHLDRLLK